MTQGEPPGWFKDEQGKFLFDHWMNGSGKALSFVNGSWGNYMRANSYLNGQITDVLSADLATRTGSGYFSVKITGDTGYNDYDTGYGLLHGSSNFNIQGWATNNGDGTYNYWTVNTWADEIDPNYQYEGDYVAKPLYL